MHKHLCLVLQGFKSSKMGCLLVAGTVACIVVLARKQIVAKQQSGPCSLQHPNLLVHSMDLCMLASANWMLECIEDDGTARSADESRKCSFQPLMQT